MTVFVLGVHVTVPFLPDRACISCKSSQYPSASLISCSVVVRPARRARIAIHSAFPTPCRFAVSSAFRASRRLAASNGMAGR